MSSNQLTLNLNELNYGEKIVGYLESFCRKSKPRLKTRGYSIDFEEGRRDIVVQISKNTIQHYLRILTEIKPYGIYFYFALSNNYQEFGRIRLFDPDKKNVHESIAKEIIKLKTKRDFIKGIYRNIKTRWSGGKGLKVCTR